MKRNLIQVQVILTSELMSCFPVCEILVPYSRDSCILIANLETSYKLQLNEQNLIFSLLDTLLKHTINQVEYFTRRPRSVHFVMNTWNIKQFSVLTRERRRGEKSRER